MPKSFRYLWKTVVVSVFVASVLGISLQALKVPPTPTDIPVVDQTDTLTSTQKQALSEKIAAERNNSGNQIAVLMIDSLEGEVLEEYSLDVARSWGIGQKDRNSGVLLLVAKTDREVRIEVGYGLEGSLPDIRANRIIADRIVPEFRQGKYYEGIDSGLEGIIMAIHDEKDPNLGNVALDPVEEGLVFPVLLFLGLSALSWLGAILGRSKRVWPGGAIGLLAGLGLSAIPNFLMLGLFSVIPLAVLGLLFDKVVSTNYASRMKSGRSPSWWAGGTHLGGGGYRGGGGGFGGFGGGGFGGGGASGRW